jgi:hypothetical protein
MQCKISSPGYIQQSNALLCSVRSPVLIIFNNQMHDYAVQDLQFWLFSTIKCITMQCKISSPGYIQQSNALLCSVKSIVLIIFKNRMHDYAVLSPMQIASVNNHLVPATDEYQFHGTRYMNLFIPLFCFLLIEYFVFYILYYSILLICIIYFLFSSLPLLISIRCTYQNFVKLVAITPS